MGKKLKQLPYNSTIYLYGKGYMGETYYQIIQNLRNDITLKFIDDSQKGQNTMSFNQFIKLKKREPFFIINCVISKNIKKKIDNKIRTNGYSKYLVKLTGIDKFVLENRFPFHHMITMKTLKENQRTINENIAFLDSKKDKKLYKDLIDYRLLDRKTKNILLNGKFLKPFGQYDESKQYCEFLNKKYINTIIEGGVFDGESSKKLKKKYLNSKGKIFGFDPMYKAFIKKKEISKLKEKKIFLFDKALWDEATTLYFKANGSASKICNNSGLKVNTLTVDQFRKKHDLKVDLLKLDVEGAESKVLQGAKKTILKDRPQLAISIYHSVDDMIYLVNNIIKMTKEYIYKIGHYNHYTHETVLYAIPKEKIKR